MLTLWKRALAMCFPFIKEGEPPECVAARSVQHCLQRRHGQACVASSCQRRPHAPRTRTCLLPAAGATHGSQWRHGGLPGPCAIRGAFVRDECASARGSSGRGRTRRQTQSWRINSRIDCTRERKREAARSTVATLRARRLLRLARPPKQCRARLVAFERLASARRLARRCWRVCGGGAMRTALLRSQSLNVKPDSVWRW